MCLDSYIVDNENAPGTFPLVASNVFGSVMEFSFTGCDSNGNEETYLNEP
jgi:hypothetical protein